MDDEEPIYRSDPNICPAAQLRVPQIEWVDPPISFAQFCRDSGRRTLQTWGLHYFWARAEGRRRVYECVRVDGQPLVWTGTGRELFMVFLAVVSMISAVILVDGLLQYFSVVPPNITDFEKWRLLLGIPAMYLIGIVAWRSFEHDLERTGLRGSFFKLEGMPWRYAWWHLWTAFLIPLTLGWIIPWRTNKLHGMKIAGIRFDEKKFRSDGRAGPLYRRFAVAWVAGIAIYLSTAVMLGLTIGPEIIEAKDTWSRAPLLQWHVGPVFIAIIVCGLVAFGAVATWYRAMAFGRSIGAIRVDDVAFDLQMPLGPFFRMSLGNTAIKCATLGLWAPYADARLAKFVVAHLTTQRAGETVAPKSTAPFGQPAPAPVHV